MLYVHVSGKLSSMDSVDTMVTRRIIIAMVFARTVLPAKILFTPANVNSHIIQNGRLACGLANEGHDVTMIVPSNAKIPGFLKDSRVDTVKYHVPEPVPYVNTEEVSQLLVGAALAESFFESFKLEIELDAKVLQHWQSECEAMMASTEVQKHMQNNHYDICVVDNAAVDCHGALAVAHKIPVILYGIMFYQWVYRVPALPSFVPMYGSQCSDKMTFAERFKNTMMMVLNAVALPQNVSLFDTYAPSANITSTVQIYRDAVMYLVHDDPIVSFPHPMMPNMEYVGDIIYQTPSPLPDSIKNFVNNAQEGIILVSFGSFFDFIPYDIAEKFCRIFRTMKQSVIWKMKRRDICQDADDKVLMLDWLPQNDLLAHPNVRLFISHCGLNSVMESVFQGTPLLCVPLSIDQPDNAARVQSKGFGLRMNLKDFTDEELRHKSRRIMEDKQIQENVAKASAMMKDKLTSPSKRVSHIVNQITKYGHKHLRTSAFELNDLQFFMVDIVLALAGVVVVVVLMVYCTCCLCYKFVRKCCCRRPSKTTKDKTE